MTTVTSKDSEGVDINDAPLTAPEMRQVQRVAEAAQMRVFVVPAGTQIKAFAPGIEDMPEPIFVVEGNTICDASVEHPLAGRAAQAIMSPHSARKLINEWGDVARPRIVGTA